MGYSNVSRPMGFKMIEGGGKVGYNVQDRPIAATRQASAGGNASTDIAVGDAYSIDQNGSAYRAGPNDVVRGVCIGFRLLANQSIMGGQGPVSVDYSSATADTLLGIEDNNTQFEVQADNFTAAMIGMNVNLADAAPDSTFGQSRQTITTAAAGIQFKAMNLLTSFADNAYGTNARVVVRMLQSFEN